METMLAEADGHVVGAGFAGCLLARELARRGARVVLLDRQVPGVRLKCAGGLPRTTLAQLGVDIPSAPVERAMVSIAGRTIDFSMHYTVVDRRRLDRAVFEQALAAGATFVQADFLHNDLAGRRATVLVDGVRREFAYRKLVLAHGVGPRRRTLWGEPLPPDRAAAMPHGVAQVEIVAQASPHPGAMFVEPDDALVAGYGWVFAMPEGRLNVGFGSLAASRIASPRLAELKARLGIVGPVLARGGGLLPLRPAAQVRRGATMLFGDAAGMALALNGEGLRYIAKFAPVWAEALLADADPGPAWYASREFRRLRFGANVMPVLSFAGRALRLPAYRWATIAGAHARRLGLR